MKSLETRQAARRSRSKTGEEQTTVTNENSEFAPHDSLHDQLVHSAQLDAKIAAQDADRRTQTEHEGVAKAMSVSKKAADKGDRQAVSAAQDAGSKQSTAPTEIKRQGAQPSEAVDKTLVDKDAVKESEKAKAAKQDEKSGNGGAAWTPNKTA